MREPIIDSSWSPDIQRLHRDHQQFIDLSVRPNAVSWYQERTDTILRLLKKHAPMARSVLDIGCAQGTIAISLAESGYSVTANDIREHFIAYARMRDDRGVVNFVSGNFLALTSEGPFDAAIFTEVIEHVADHKEFLSHIYKHMKPGGTLIVTTPSHEYFRESLPTYSEVNMVENKHKEFSADGSDHFYLFTKAELINILVNNGFTYVDHFFFLPFIQAGSLKTWLLWKIFPRTFLEYLSRCIPWPRALYMQQCAIVRKRSEDGHSS